MSLSETFMISFFPDRVTRGMIHGVLVLLSGLIHSKTSLGITKNFKSMCS